MRFFKPTILALSFSLFACAVTVDSSPARAQDQRRSFGKPIGLAGLTWGMTPAEILAAPMEGVAKVSALPGKGAAFQISDLQLNPGSIYGWTLQLWVDKKGLSAFDLRPTKEIYTNTMIGYPDEKIAAEFQSELDLYVERTFKLKPDQWWQTSDQVQVRVKSKRSQTTMVQPPDLYIPSPSGSGPGAYVPQQPYPVTRSYKQFQPLNVPLFFSIKDRAWAVRDSHYRQGYLFNSTSERLRMAVTRFQGRREGKAFEPMTGGLIKTKKSDVIINAIFKNYNVIPEKQ